MAQKNKEETSKNFENSKKVDPNEVAKKNKRRGNTNSKTKKEENFLKEKLKAHAEADRLVEMTTEFGRRKSIRSFDGFVQRFRNDDQKGEEDVIYPKDKVDKLYVLKGRKIKYPFFIIPVRSMLRLRWDLCIMLIIIYGSFYYPIELAFESDTTGVWWLPYAIDKIALVIFWLDILLSFRTTYFNENNEEVVSGKLIAKKYLKSFAFILDVTSALPVTEITEFIEFVEYGQGFQVLLLVKIIRLLRMNRIVKYIKQDSLKNAFKLGKLFVYFILLIHWITCTWLIMVQLQFDEEEDTDLTAWVPTNIRIVGGFMISPSESYWTIKFYNEASGSQV